MKGLEGLIRVHKWRLEEERKTLGNLLHMRETFVRATQEIRAEIAREKEAANDVTVSFTFGPYVKAAMNRIEALSRSINETDVAIGEAEDRVAAAYREERKYELAFEARRKRDAERLDRSERIAMDEIALNQHRRSNTQ